MCGGWGGCLGDWVGDGVGCGGGIISFEILKNMISG